MATVLTSAALLWYPLVCKCQS